MFPITLHTHFNIANILLGLVGGEEGTDMDTIGRKMLGMYFITSITAVLDYLILSILLMSIMFNSFYHIKVLKLHYLCFFTKPIVKKIEKLILCHKA